MANFQKMKLTNKGLELLASVQGGADNLTFTKTALGNGILSDTPISKLTALVSPKVEIPITEGKHIGVGTYQIASFFSNKEVTVGFWWREVGVFAKGNDGKEILYCYANAGDAGDYIPVGNDERVEKYIYQSLSIGNAESVTVEINESESFILTADKGKAHGVAPLNADGKVDNEYLPEMNFVPIGEGGKVSNEYLPEMNFVPIGEGGKIDETYIPDLGFASQSTVSDLSGEFITHKNGKNPHGITAETVGLDKVPNVATNDQTPTYTESASLTTLISGEKISVSLGKIKKAITDFISHRADTTKHITSTERTSWNNKAPTSHASTGATYGVGTSSNYGHLKITDSVNSTATDTAASAKALKMVNDAVSLQLKVATGSYDGSGGENYGSNKPNVLTFDFVPKLVIIHSKGTTNQYKTGFVWMPGMTQIHYAFGGSSSSSDLEITIALNDKTLTWYSTFSAERQMNSTNETYYYIAIS